MDIVERLRNNKGGESYTWQTISEAANEIERLREENKQYLECLTMMAKVALEALKPKDED